MTTKYKTVANLRENSNSINIKNIINKNITRLNLSTR